MSIVKKIESVLTTQNEQLVDMSCCAELLTRFGIKGVNDWLIKLLSDRESLQKVANLSHLQGNGFYKINLYEQDLFSLRLHIWFPDVIAQENLHSHRWPFASTILYGSLQSELWDDDISGNARHYDEYLYLGRDHELLPIGKAKVTLTQKKIFSQGEAYTLKSDQLHRIVRYSGEGMSATLMCRYTYTRSWARNIVVNSRIPNIGVKSLTCNELESIIKNYLFLTQNS